MIENNKKMEIPFGEACGGKEKPESTKEVIFRLERDFYNELKLHYDRCRSSTEPLFLNRCNFPLTGKTNFKNKHFIANTTCKKCETKKTITKFNL